MPFQPGQRVGDYEVVKLLGAGGMGHVYRVRNIISNRNEAMKVLLPDLTAEPELGMRFISEIRTLAGFDHPNIAQLHTALQADNQLIMIMEFVEGYTLEEMARQRKLSVQEVAGFLSQGLSALGYAHEHGVIHRDIKPANLMVTSHGVIKLMDFGIAKSNAENNAHTKPGTTMGSLYYMSPEQVRGQGVDARSDIYSVGIVLYELLAGRRPFEADTTFSILNQQINTPPQPPIEVNPSLPRVLNDIILRALEKDPARRFQTAEEFRSALKPFMNSPGGHEVMAAATQPMPAPPSAAVAPQAAPPVPQGAYQPVPPPHMPPPQQGYPGPQYGAPMPPPRSGGKGIWIATGAVAGVLALVGIAFAVPHFLHTRAATDPATAAAVSTPAATVTATPTTVPTTQTPASATLPVSNSPAPASAPVDAPLPAIASSPAAHTHAGGTAHANQMPGPASAMPSAAAPAPASASNAAMDEAEERLMQTTARANTAKRGVASIRSQQEASGLGLRGDIESAESRMDGYLNAAHNNMNRGNAAGATNNLDKAEAELSTLEKFLGH